MAVGYVLLAELGDVRLRDLRHSFASVAVSEGASLPIIGALLGQTDAATTQRYAHLSNDPVRADSEEVRTVDLMERVEEEPSTRGSAWSAEAPSSRTCRADQVVGG